MRLALLAAFLALPTGLVGQAAKALPEAEGLRRYVNVRPAPDAAVRPRYVYCADWSAWVEQQEAREHDEQSWADVVRRHFTTGQCLITRGGERLRVIGEADDGPRGHLFAYIVAGPSGAHWYISPLAWEWPK